MEQANHRPTLRVMEVLELISERSDGYTLSDISTKLKIPKGTLFPIIRTLQDEQYIRKEESSSRYMLGIKSYELGNKFIEQVNILDEVKQLVKRVVNNCNETCHFAIRDGKDVVYLLKEESPEPIRMVSSIGMRLPAHSTAIGKALLSECDELEIRTLYSDGLAQITQNTITDIDELCRQINLIKTEKLAYETEESSLNVTCIAVPIEKEGDVVAAISVSVPIFRAGKEKMDEIKKILLETKVLAERLVEKKAFRI